MADLAYTGIYGDLMVTGVSKLTENVGINIDVPLDMLDVGGNIRMTGSLRTRASILNFENAGGSLVPIRASSLVIAPSTTYSTGSGTMYVHAGIGVGAVATEGLSINAASSIKSTGQYISTQDSSKPPMMVSSNALVINLNADKVDGYEGKDIFNNIMDLAGDGVLSGLKVIPQAGTKKITVTAGKALIRDLGIIVKSEENFSSDFIPGEKYVIFIVGKAGLLGDVSVGVGVTVFRGRSDGWPNMADYAHLNPVLLARIDFPSISASIDYGHIVNDRKMAAVFTMDGVVNLLRSDNANMVSSANYEPTSRVKFEKSGDSTIMSISNILNPGSTFNNVKKTSQVYPDKIVFTEAGSIPEAEEINRSKIQLWDNSNSLKHTHYYDAGFYIEDGGYRLRLETVLSIVNRASFRIYVNGLRKKLGVDYVEDVISTAVRFNYPLDSQNDVIVLDYDE